MSASITSGWGGEYGAIPWGGYVSAVIDPQSKSEEGGVITDEGLAYLIRRAGSSDPPPIQGVAIGTGTRAEAASDTDLYRELYRGEPVTTSVDDNTATFVLDVVGGEDVPPGVEITEFGLFTSEAAESGTLVYRITRDPVIVSDGEHVRFEVEFDISHANDKLTTEGQRYILERCVHDEDHDPIGGVWVGTETGDIARTRQNMVYPAAKLPADDVDASDNSLSATVSVTGGLGVEPGTTLTEFALYGSYIEDGREILITHFTVDESNGITVGRGETKYFASGLEFQRV